MKVGEVGFMKYGGTSACGWASALQKPVWSLLLVGLITEQGDTLATKPTVITLNASWNVEVLWTVTLYTWHGR